MEKISSDKAQQELAERFKQRDELIEAYKTLTFGQSLKIEKSTWQYNNNPRDFLALLYRKGTLNPLSTRSSKTHWYISKLKDLPLVTGK